MTMRTADILSCQGKLVVITGGNGMLGSQWRQALLDRDAAVFPLDLPSWDVTSKESMRKALAFMRDAYAGVHGAGVFSPRGAPDALICAAALDRKPGDETYDEEAAMAVGIDGTINAVGVFGEAMAAHGGGSIILVGSLYGMLAPDQNRYEPGFVKPLAYSVTKAALLGITRWYAEWWGRTGVRVNLITLGGVGRDQDSPYFRKSYEARTMLGRMARVGDYDGLIAYLVSDASSYVTGANIVADGGYSAW